MFDRLNVKETCRNEYLNVDLEIKQREEYSNIEEMIKEIKEEKQGNEDENEKDIPLNSGCNSYQEALTKISEVSNFATLIGNNDLWNPINGVKTKIEKEISKIEK